MEQRAIRKMEEVDPMIRASFDESISIFSQNCSLFGNLIS